MNMNDLKELGAAIQPRAHTMAIAQPLYRPGETVHLSGFGRVRILNCTLANSARHPSGWRRYRVEGFKGEVFDNVPECDLSTFLKPWPRPVLATPRRRL